MCTPLAHAVSLGESARETLSVSSMICVTSTFTAALFVMRAWKPLERPPRSPFKQLESEAETLLWTRPPSQASGEGSPNKTSRVTLTAIEQEDGHGHMCSHVETF